MHIYLLFAHPSKQSFTWEALCEFKQGLLDAGHTVEIGDLYEMRFRAEMDETQYLRETHLDAHAPLPNDVRREQEKIERAAGLAFVYPVWWSDCPAILKGWFDRVWSYGYAYVYTDAGHSFSTIRIEKALVLCPAGHTVEHLEETGIAESMRRIMLQDRLLGVGVKNARLEILGGMVEKDEAIRRRNLAKAYKLGREF
ncbi:flavodoxin family protein [candidate division KSB1 bacterium]|nr:MAG: flavodoxin family protein [candidate division KSB1 bacterium]